MFSGPASAVYLKGLAKGRVDIVKDLETSADRDKDDAQKLQVLSSISSSLPATSFESPSSSLTFFLLSSSLSHPSSLASSFPSLPLH